MDSPSPPEASPEPVSDSLGVSEEVSEEAPEEVMVTTTVEGTDERVPSPASAVEKEEMMEKVPLGWRVWLSMSDWTDWLSELDPTVWFSVMETDPIPLEAVNSAVEVRPPVAEPEETVSDAQHNPSKQRTKARRSLGRNRSSVVRRRAVIVVGRHVILLVSVAVVSSNTRVFAIKLNSARMSHSSAADAQKSQHQADRRQPRGSHGDGRVGLPSWLEILTASWHADQRTHPQLVENEWNNKSVKNERK